MRWGEKNKQKNYSIESVSDDFLPIFSRYCVKSEVSDDLAKGNIIQREFKLKSIAMVDLDSFWVPFRFIQYVPLCYAKLTQDIRLLQGLDGYRG